MDPRTREYLDDPEYLKLIQQLQTNPELLKCVVYHRYYNIILHFKLNQTEFLILIYTFFNFRNKMADPRILKTLSVILGVNIREDMDVDPPPQPAKPSAPTTKTSESQKPAEDLNLPPEKREAIKEKTLGNEAYKKKDFETALKHYFKAIELDPTEITYYNNVAGNIFITFY